MKHYFKVTTQEGTNIFSSFIARADDDQIVKAAYNNWVIVNQIPSSNILDELAMAERKNIPLIDLEIIRKPI